MMMSQLQIIEDNNGNIEYSKKILKSQRKGNNLDEGMKETNRKEIKEDVQMTKKLQLIKKIEKKII